MLKMFRMLVVDCAPLDKKTLITFCAECARGTEPLPLVITYIIYKRPTFKPAQYVVQLSTSCELNFFVSVRDQLKIESSLKSLILVLIFGRALIFVTRNKYYNQQLISN